MTADRRSARLAFDPRRLLAALAAAVVVWGGLGIHLGPHDHAGESLTAGSAIAACANHLRTVHVEAQRTIQLRECPACLLSHSNLGAVRPLGPALSAAAPEILSAAPAPAASRLAPHAASSRGPPALSV